MNFNTLKAKLAAGETVVGTFVRFSDPGLIEFMALQHWDFIVVDAEHAANEARDAENLCRAAELREVTPLVRVPALQQHVILRYLDAGMYGIHAPLVSTAADAGSVVQAVKYPPWGRRGLAGVRAANYGQRGPLHEYVDFANRETLIVVQIETAEALENIDAIAAVEGVDVLFVGLTDLASSMGYKGDTSTPELLRQAETAVTAIRDAGKIPGVIVTSVEQARRWRERGARYLLTNFESVYGPTARQFVRDARVG